MAGIGRKRPSARRMAQVEPAPVVIERLVEPCILLLLSSAASCGYELYQRIRTDCLYTAVDLPTVYRALRRLEAQSMIARAGQIGPRQKQLYSLSYAGQQYLEDWMIGLRESTRTTDRLLAQYSRRDRTDLEHPGVPPAIRSDDAVQKDQKQMYKVVVQYNVAGREEHVLMQLRGLMQEFGPGGLDLVVVAHGDGIGLVTDPTYQDAILALVNDGASFLGCAVTLQRQQMTQDNLVPGASATPGALAEIIRRQHDGYAYLRPF